MLPSAFNIRLDGDCIVSGPLVIPVSDPSESIMVAVTRAYTAAHGTPTLGAFEFGIIRWRPSDASVEYLMVSVNNTTTTERFYQAFGPLASGEPPVLSLQVDGIGGDGELADLAGSTFKVYKVVNGVLSIRDSLLYREHRREIGDWEDTGEITMRLRQLVLAEQSWDPKAFSRVFNITGRDRGNLLSALGYRIDKSSGHKTWIEIAPG